MKRLLFALLLLAFALPLMAQMGVEVTPAEWEPFVGTDPILGTSLVGFGYARYAVTTAVQLTAAPAAGNAIHRLARHAILKAEDGQIRIRYDGTNPTATEGELLDVGQTKEYRGQRALLLQLRMISVSGAAVKVTVTYGR